MGIALSGMSSILAGSTKGWVDPKVILEQEKENAPILIGLNVYNKSNTKPSILRRKKLKSSLEYNHTPSVWYDGEWEVFHRQFCDRIGFNGMLLRQDRTIYWYVPAVSPNRILKASEWDEIKKIKKEYNDLYLDDAWSRYKECVAKIKATLGL